MGPARMIVKSLTSRPGIREQNRPLTDFANPLGAVIAANPPFPVLFKQSGQAI